MYTDEDLGLIYDRTAGRCHLCGRKMAYSNYARLGARRAWEVDHSVPRARGGSDRANNLYGACIGCNRAKGQDHSKTVRRRNGFTAAPLSIEAARVRRSRHAVGGALCGGLIGLMLGPGGAIAGMALGAALGHSAKVQPAFDKMQTRPGRRRPSSQVYHAAGG